MRELEKEYGDQIDFDVREATSPEGVKAKETYGWTDALHGLVTLDRSGKMVGQIPSHNYGRPAIEAKVKQLLEQ